MCTSFRRADTAAQGLTQAVVSDQDGINRLMDQGQKMRTVGATAMNETSSRSHSIFTIVVEMNDVDEAGKDHIRVGKARKPTVVIFVFVLHAAKKLVWSWSGIQLNWTSTFIVRSVRFNMCM